jgi:hypothetical protein
MQTSPWSLSLFITISFIAFFTSCTYTESRKQTSILRHSEYFFYTANYSLLFSMLAFTVWKEPEVTARQRL